MRHSTVSAPVESCNVSSLSSPTLRFCALHLLQGQTLYFVVEPKSKTKELYNQACAYFASHGMFDTDLFGLAIDLEGEYFFVDPDCKLSKYSPKNWRSSSTHGLDSIGKPLLVFYFRVQFYVDSPLLLRDEISRHQYYLQLRQNVVERNLSHPYVAEEIICLLVGLALQADFGDYDRSQHTDNYFSLQQYFPQQMVPGQETRLYNTAVAVHQANCALSKAQAETQFIREASSRGTLSLAHNSHLYRLKRNKHDLNPGTLWLAICTRGIELYEEKSSKPINGTFLWNNIGKLCFDRKKFEIRSLHPAGERMVYYTNSDEKSKHLLTLCKLTHQFCMAIQPRLSELTKKEEEEKKHLRKLATDFNVKLSEINYNHNADQRISVISTTSSNTTSGIVSDRVHSLDESEDDIDMEIMINSPPAVSIESLALAHLRDSFSSKDNNKKINKNFAHNSLSVYHPGAGEVRNENSDLVTGVNKYALPSTPAPTDGSQCSSSCSTVVVDRCSREKIKTQVRETSVIALNRSHSTSSSLELGYSHTAQNSTLSDSASCCLELDYSVQSAHASSGIYTMQSTCETNTVATTILAGSSETSGLGQSVIEDSEGIRSRSGSIVSASGSFHGDGSDPSDTGHGTPLTAEELSDLIVGKTPKPCRGKYPPVATVSESLDSVADYVTLPPPPIPPATCLSFESKGVHTFSPTTKQCWTLPKEVFPKETYQKYYSEEAMLQRQIQFQHLAGNYSSHMLMSTLSTQPIMRNACCLPSTKVLRASTGDLLHDTEHRRLQHCESTPGIAGEEATARIISMKPQVNILKTQTSCLMPSYATPVTPRLQAQHSFSCSRYPNFSFYKKQGEGNLPPVVGSNNYLDVRQSGAAFLQHIHEKFPPPPPPVLHNRQPPPPPPRNQYSMCPSHHLDQYRQQLYSDVDYVIYPMKDPAISKQEYLDSKVATGHCIQYLSQTSLNSSYCAQQRQEHRHHSTPTINPRPLYNYKSSALYRSTPNVNVVASPASPAGNCGTASPYYPYSNAGGAKYTSNQNLSTEMSSKCYSNSSVKYLSNMCSSSISPLCSMTTSAHSTSMQNLRQESSIYGHTLASIRSCGGFTRVRSDDNILNCIVDRVTKLDSKFQKPPPPPPPPYNFQKKLFSLPEHITAVPCSAYWTSEKHTNVKETNRRLADTRNTNLEDAKNVSLDICSLREKSKNLDLPLIAALCNDKSLLKQTNTIDDTGKKQKSVCSLSSWYNDFNAPVAENTSSKNSCILDCSSPKCSEALPLSMSLSLALSPPSLSSKLLSESVEGPSNSSSATSNVIEPTSWKASPRRADVYKLGRSVETSKSLPNKCVSSKGTKSSEMMVSTAKMKSINAKFAKTTSSTNKLRYSITQPNVKLNETANNIRGKILKSKTTRSKSLDASMIHK